MYETHAGEGLLLLGEYVGERLSRVRHWLREGAPGARSQQRVQELLLESRRQGVVFPDQAMSALLGLSGVDQEVLWWSCAGHLDGELVALLQERFGQEHVDVALLQRVMRGGVWGDRALRLSLGALVRAGLVVLGGRGRRVGGELRQEVVPCGHVLCALDGRRESSLERAGVGEALRPAVTLSALEPVEGRVWEALEALRGFRERGSLSEGWFGPGGVQVSAGVCVGIDAPRGHGASLCGRALAGQLGAPVLEVWGEALSRSVDGEAQTRQVFEEARAHGEVVVLRDAEWVCAQDRALAPCWAWHVRRSAVAVVLCSTSRPAWHAGLGDALVVQVTGPWGAGAGAQELWWQLHLPGECEVEAGALGEVSGQLALSPGQVRGAVRLLHLAAPAREGVLQVSHALLRRAARGQLEGPTSALARLVERDARLSDVILPEETRQEVEALVSAVRSRRKIMESWGLRAALGRGVGLSALFDGEPGTGKTLAAEAIAGQCQMALMQVDTSAIVDKYIGETEKNLSELFLQARPDMHILLFDEADSLFGKRTEVRHATDRYANMNINTLLQLIERYEGVVILTTNLKKSIDPAFERRLTFKINFPKPGEEERRQIWERLLRPPLKLQGEVELRELAEVELTGGEIKNALLKAAYRAAQAGALLDTEALIDAALDEARGAGHLIKGR